jgi:uncharacterized membrane protein YfcA
MLAVLVLFIVAFAAVAISGAAGFGGALLLLPLLIAMVGPTQAVPLLTVAQLVGNLARAGFGFNQIQWRPVGLFLLGALPMSVLGALSFVELPKDVVTRAIGAAILLFVALRFFGRLQLKAGAALLILGGGMVGFLSGLLGSAGPIGAAVFLTLGMPPVAYIASEATTALAMHGVKTLVYQQFIVLDRAFWLLAGMLGVAMVLGTWAARRVIERMPQRLFQHFVAILLGIIGSYMLIHG